LNNGTIRVGDSIMVVDWPSLFV